MTDRMIGPSRRPVPSMIGSIPKADLVFHTAPPGQTVWDSRSGMMLRVDGYWKTHAGRTVTVVLSAPGSILRAPCELRDPATSAPGASNEAL